MINKEPFIGSFIFFSLLSSTKFTVPKGVKKIDCFCVGGGGGGEVGGSSGSDYGGKSSIGSICSAFGGLAGTTNIASVNPRGGSGGGGGCGWYDGNWYMSGGNGGSDGSDGGNGAEAGFIGQGTTTRYFGETNGTLYAGGGGGGGYWNGKGGAGGGGNGIRSYTGVDDPSITTIFLNATSGEINTGGGGGGDTRNRNGGGNGGRTDTKLAQSVTPGDTVAVTVGAGGYVSPYTSGGSGICIIRWGKQ